MEQVRDGIWHWTAPHPSWDGHDDWAQLVSSYALDDGGRLLLIDPLAIPADVEELSAARDTRIVLTCPWHHRDAEEWGPSHDVPLHHPPYDEGDPNEPAGTVFRAGEVALPGVEAHLGLEPNDLVLWIPAHGALVFGDTLVDRGRGLEIPIDWAERRDLTRDDVRDRLRPLLDLPVDVVLATHGGAFDRDALETVVA